MNLCLGLLNGLASKVLVALFQVLPLRRGGALVVVPLVESVVEVRLFNRLLPFGHYCRCFFNLALLDLMCGNRVNVIRVLDARRPGGLGVAEGGGDAAFLPPALVPLVAARLHLLPLLILELLITGQLGILGVKYLEMGAHGAGDVQI